MARTSSNKSFTSDINKLNKMNTHVDFETSKLLKEKKFNIPIRTAWYLGEVGYWKIPVNHNESSVKVSAPTIAEVIMWLYEKHGIWVTTWSDTNLDLVEYKDSAKWFYVINCNLIDCYDSTGKHKYLFNSPTEAYQEAITYVLKNLIK